MVSLTLFAASKYSRLLSGSATMVLSPGFQFAGHTWWQGHTHKTHDQITGGSTCHC